MRSRVEPFVVAGCLSIAALSIAPPLRAADLTAILRNQLEVLSAHPSAFETKVLVLEIEALETGRQGIPWETGLPATISESLAPYRARLANSYCAGIAGIELRQKNKGLNFKG